MSLQGQNVFGLDFGTFGHVFVTSSDDVSTKKFAVIQAFGGNAQVDYVDRSDNNKTGTKTNISIPDGALIYGNIESLNVDTGTILAYYQLNQRTENE